MFGIYLDIQLVQSLSFNFLKGQQQPAGFIFFSPFYYIHVSFLFILVFVWNGYTKKL